MANRSSRNPGELARFDMSAAISQDVPSYAVYTGQASEALANVAGNLSARLGQMADRARKREGEIAGLAHVQQNYAGWESGTAYNQQQAVSTDAVHTAATGDEAAARMYLQARTDKDRSHIEGMKGRFAVNLAKLFQSAPDGIREGLGVYSGFRSVERQAELWAQALKKYGSADAARKWVAPPGRSNHNHGNAGDLSYNGRSLKHAPAHVVSWLHQNAASYNLAFPLSNENWHIEDAGARGKVQPAGKVSVKADTFATQPLSREPIALRRDGTIFGEAFDDAAQSAWSWRMQEGISTDLFAAQLEHQDDPQGFAAAAGEIRAKYASEIADPRMQEVFAETFARNTRAYGMNIAARHEARLRDEQEASYAAGLAARTVDLERQAQVLGANPEGDAIIGEQVAMVQRSIDGAYQQGTISAAQAERAKEDVAKTAAFGRVQGVFEALGSPEAKEQFALDLLEDWRAGKGVMAKLPFAEVKARSDMLFNAAREQINRKMAANKGEIARIDALIKDDVASLAASGKGLDPAESGLSVDRVRDLAGDQAVAAWQVQQDRARRLYSATNGMEVQSAADIAERLRVMRPQPGKAGYGDEVAIFDAAQKRAQDVLKERETDPLGQAARGGALELSTIVPTSSEALTESLQARRAQRDQVAGLYQQDVPFFRPGEKELLSSALAERPEMLPAFAQTVAKVFGNQAPRVLSELSEDAPVIAHAAGLSLSTGDASVANDIASTIAMKRQKVFTAKMPSQGDMSNFAAGQIGGALFADGRTQGALVQTASILFEQMANLQGFDPTDIKTEGSIAQLAFSRALDRAAGGRSIGGIAYGGLGDVNGGRIIVPADLPKDRPQSLLRNLTEEQLSQLPPILSGNGFPVPVSRIREAQLVSAGDGLYRVALGDAMGDEPQFLANPDGGFWLLDIRALERVSQTTPGANDFNLFGWQPQR